VFLLLCVLVLVFVIVLLFVLALVLVLVLVLAFVLVFVFVSIYIVDRNSVNSSLHVRASVSETERATIFLSCTCASKSARSSEDRNTSSGLCELWCAR
jgi:hypothetical protein